MGSTRAGVGAPGEFTTGADLLAAAASLRWARPDLSAALADHVMETASDSGDRDAWLGAAAWAVHARSATADPREVACGVLEGLARWGVPALGEPAANRLRVELAMVAAGAGELDAARGLLADIDADEGDAELRADLLTVRARCAVEDAPEEVADAIRAAEKAWSRLGGSSGEIGAASVALIDAVVQRRAQRPDAAVDRASAGLARLQRVRGPERAGTPSGHLAAALAAEWISALLDAGRVEEAREGCGALMSRLSEPSRPSRQLALLRLTVARTVALGESTNTAAALLERAAEDAVASDVPDLEAVCWSALAAVHEKAGRLDATLEALQRSVAAERRDRSRMQRLRAALAELPIEAVRGERTLPPRTEGSDVAPTTARGERAAINKGGIKEPADLAGQLAGWEDLLRPPAGRERRPREDRSDDTSRSSSEPATPKALEPPSESVTPRAAELASESVPRGSSEPESQPEALEEDLSSGWGAIPWGGTMGESPIGDLLLRSMRAGAVGAEGRNGRQKRSERDADASGSDPVQGPAASNGSAEQQTRFAPRTDEPRKGGRRRAADREDEPTRSTSHGRASAQPPTAKERGTRTGDPGDQVGEAAPGRASGGSGRHEAGEPSSHGRPTDRDAVTGRGSGRSRPPSSHRRIDAEAESTAERKQRPASRMTLDELIAEVKRRAAEASDTESDSVRNAAPRSERRQGDGPADPWSTGRWPVPPSGKEHESHSRAEETSEADVDRTAARSEMDRDRWLRAALADLDRAARQAAARLEEHPSEEKCAVVIDLARDGRRFAGRRAGAVIRAVADRLTDRLPTGGRLRFEDTDALTITGPGWGRTEATQWMHGTLPGLLEGLVVTGHVPTAQLRAAVHNADGPVGAQILQSLEGVSDQDDKPALGARRTRAYRAEESVGRRERRGRPPEAGSANDDDLRDWPWPGDRHGAGADGPGEQETDEDRSRLETGFPAGSVAASAEGRRARGEHPADRRTEARHEAEDRSAPRGGDDAGGSRHGREVPGPLPSSEGRSRAGRRGRRAEEDGPDDRHGEDGRDDSTGPSGADDRADTDPVGKAGADDTKRGRAEKPTGTGHGSTARRGSGAESGEKTAGAGGGSDADRSDTERGNADPSRADPSSADPSGADPSGADPSGADPSSADPGSADGSCADRKRQAGAAESSGSTDGLGIADLLAGALAAYRGI